MKNFNFGFILLLIATFCYLPGCVSSNSSQDDDKTEQDDGKTTPTTSVPDLRFLKAQETNDALDVAGLTLGAVAGEYRLKMTTGSTISQSPAPGTIVEEGTAIDITRVAAHLMLADEILPQDWAGQWRMKTVYIQSDKYFTVWKNDTLCEGDPLGAGLAKAMLPDLNCTTSTSEYLAEISCSGNLDVEQCEVEANLSYGLANNANGTIEGNGEWSTISTCIVQGIETEFTDGETIIVEGTRVGFDVTECDEQKSSFLQKFVHAPFLQEPIF